MSTFLQRFVGGLSGVFEDAERRTDEALNSLPPPPAVIAGWENYTIFVARVYCRLEGRMLGIADLQLNPSMHVSLALQLLHEVFDGSAAQAGFEIARTGINGGTRYIMRTMAQAYAREYAKNLISIAVEDYCANRSVTELLCDADEYVARYRHLIPSEIAEGSAARIHGNFREVLKQHPFVERRIRRSLG